MIPQIIIIIAIVVNLGLHIHNDGEKRPVHAIDALIGSTFLVIILWWGGFWG